MGINIVLPIGGNNKDRSGNPYILNLYEIKRKTMLQHIIDSLSNIKDASFIIIIKKEDIEECHLDSIIHLMIPDAKIIISEGETKGMACTCLLAIDEIENNTPLLIAAGNQLVHGKIPAAVNRFEKEKWDGGVIIFDDVHPRWSYVKLDKNGFVVEAAEKKPISKNATAGFYYFKRSYDFISATENMIRKQASVDGKFYVCPVFNEMVLQNKLIGTYRIEKKDYFNFNDIREREEYEMLLDGRRENFKC